MKRRLVLPVLAALMTASGFMVVSGGSADASTTAAWPDDCTIYKQPQNGASVICQSGGGQYQVVIACRSLITEDTDFFYGRWVGVGSSSLRYCPPNSYRRFEGINTKAG